MDNHYDILIIGGGMVGGSLAVALRSLGLRVGVVEAVAYDADAQPSYDSRAIALGEGARRIFDALGVWQRMVELGVTPIKRIQVSDRGHFGALRMSAAEAGVAAFGQVVEAAVIGEALQGALDGVELIAPASVVAMDNGEKRVTVEVDEAGVMRHLTCSLLVAADGGRSTVAALLAAPTVTLGYGQSAVIANVVSERPHTHTAFERFTDSGPLALLPNTPPAGWPGEGEGSNRWSLVWTVRNDQVDALLALDDASFCEALYRHFGRRVGRFVSTTPRHTYRLNLNTLRRPVAGRVVYIGNAAHQLHPVGGQGFNLGLRDVAELAEAIADALARGEEPGSCTALADYAAHRRRDQLTVMGLTDGLVRSFSTNLFPAVVARNLGLLGMQLIPSLQSRFARQFMGLAGHQSRLARGLSLSESDRSPAGVSHG